MSRDSQSCRQNERWLKFVEAAPILIVVLVGCLGVVSLRPNRSPAQVAPGPDRAAVVSQRALASVTAAMRADWRLAMAVPARKCTADDVDFEWNSVPVIESDELSLHAVHPGAAETVRLDVLHVVSHDGSGSFEAAARLWCIDEAAFSGVREVASADQFMLAFELSWPLDLPYAERQTSMRTMRVSRLPASATLAASLQR